MAGLKEIKTRIASVKSTRQITGAMKMVSAAYLRKAQDAIIQMRPYANIIKKSIEIASVKYENLFSNGQVHFTIIGKKAFDFFKNKDAYPVIEEHNSLFDKLDFENTSVIAEDLMNKFTSNAYDEIVGGAEALAG